MIRSDIFEYFPITVTLIDECTGSAVSGQTVNYVFKSYPLDLHLSPVMEGVLSESTTESGVYSGLFRIPKAGEFIVYTTCSGFTPGSENIVINEENIYDLVKQNRHYNISAEDVVRINVVPTPSQINRKVAVNKTDYIITRIKPNNALNWNSPATVSGVVYAYYSTLGDDVPYKMGDM